MCRVAPQLAGYDRIRQKPISRRERLNEFGFGEGIRFFTLPRNTFSDYIGYNIHAPLRRVKSEQITSVSNGSL